MANGLHADILYDYLVLGMPQKELEQKYGIHQTEISDIITKEYNLNKGNKKFGNGKNNQRGKYPNLTYDEICAFMDSGWADLDEWLGEGDGGYSDEEYADDGDYYEEEYEEDGSDSYDEGYNDGNGGNYGGGYAPDPYNQPQQYGGQSNGKRKKVRYVGGGFTLPDILSKDGRIVMLLLGVVLLAVGWLVNKFGSTTGAFGESLQILWHSDYLWWGVVTGGIFGFLKYQMCRNLGEVFTTCGTWAWTGVGYIVGAVVFVFRVGLILPAVILAALGVLIMFIGYKLFYRG